MRRTQILDKWSSRALFAVIAGTLIFNAHGANHALLVGVSGYPTLKENLRLAGPMNDIPLMRRMLWNQGFPVHNVRVLADQVQGSNGDPTRAAIMRELAALADKARKGDFIVLYFGGHGSQQPALDAGPTNPEPDGKDEIFLPIDVGTWKGFTGPVENAIVDDEFGAVIVKIQAAGAFVWAIFDTCHSGTITRGVHDENVRYRDVRPEDLGIPATAFEKAAARAASSLAPTRSAAEPKQMPLTGLRALAPEGGYVGFFAAQSWERAPERPLPPHLSASDPAKRSHGVFTYALLETLAMNPATTFRQVAQQILQRYRTLAPNEPTPLFEGLSMSGGTRIFGTQPGADRMQWRIERAENRLAIQAGALHQFGVGAVFAVVARPADPDSAVLGYVTATRVETMDAELRPMEYRRKSQLDPAKIPTDAYARLVQPNRSFLLRVALPPEAEDKSPLARRGHDIVARLAKEQVGELRVVWNSPAQGGDIRLAIRDNHLWLLPPTGELVRDVPLKTLSIDLAANSDAQVLDKLRESLRSIAKVNGLLELAAKTAASPIGESLETVLTVARTDPARSVAGFTTARECRTVKHMVREQIAPGSRPDLRECDTVSLEIRNNSDKVVDVWAFFIDSQYGIHVVFPYARNEVPRITPKGSARVSDIVTALTVPHVGRDGLLIIATEAAPREEPADFSFLAQASLPVTRSASDEDTLSAALEAVAFDTPRTRSGSGSTVSSRAVSRAMMRLFTWTSVAR